MKIDAKKIHNFLKKCSLDGKIETCVLRGDTVNNNMTIKVKNGNSIAVFGMLKTTTEDFSFPIKSARTLLKVLQTFSGNIYMEKKDNLLKIYDESREANIVLADESFIDNDLKEELKFEYEGDMKIKHELFKNAVKNADIVGSDTLYVEVKDNILTITTGKANFDKMTEKVKVDYKNCLNELGKISFDVIQVLDSDLTVSMKTDYPIKIREGTEDMNVIYYVAPLEQQEEGVKNEPRKEE